MSGPPFTMSKYANETDLLRDKCKWLERKLAEAHSPEALKAVPFIAELKFERDTFQKRCEQNDAYAVLCSDLLRRIRAWDVLNPLTDDKSDARFWRGEIDAVLAKNPVWQTPIVDAEGEVIPGSNHAPELTVLEPNEHGLLPCPFCGASDVDPEGWRSVNDVGPACMECGGSADKGFWNQRAAIQPSLRAAVLAFVGGRLPDLNGMHRVSEEEMRNLTAYADPLLPAMEAVCKALDAPQCERCGDTRIVTRFGAAEYGGDADDQPCPECGPAIERTVLRPDEQAVMRSALMKSVAVIPHPDTVRLDWLEKEMERELTCPRTVPPVTSIFRRNVPITREAIDGAMKAWNSSGSALEPKA